MHRSKNSFLEWFVYSLIFFFLYDIIWILVDLPDFLQSVNGLYPELLVDFALCGLFSLSSLYLNRWLFRQRRFWREGQTHRVFVQNGLVVLGFNLLIAGGCELLLSLVAPKLMMQDIWGTSFLFGLIASLVALIHLSMHFSDMIVLKGKENLALQKRYLMMQLDPHFVFNSISSLAGMIGEDPKMAEDYVVKLSHIYRYILQHIDKEYITLADGTDFIKSYISLLNMRYDNAIVLHADDLHGDRDECILSLSLQLIIENAVKHNCPQNGIELHVSLSRQGNMLVIKNNRIYANLNNDQSVESYGIGISNLKQRYRLEGEAEPEFVASQDAFEVRLPIIKRKQDYDLIFSDIRLADGDVFEAFRKVMPQSFVIFTTAYDKYAMEAIKNNGLDYLMKPIDADELRAAIGKLRLNRNAQQSAVERPLHGVLNDTRQYRERFLITKGDELCRLCADDISYINMHDNRITAFAVDGTSYPLPMSMNDLEQALDPARFFRLNRQYIANIKGIRKISLYFGSKLMVKLKGCEDDNIVISKEKATLFKKWLEK